MLPSKYHLNLGTIEKAYISRSGSEFQSCCILCELMPVYSKEWHKEGEISGGNPQLLFVFLMSKSVSILICGYNHTNLLCLFSNQNYLVSTLSYSHRYTAQTLLQRITFSSTPSPVPCCLSSVIKLLAKHYSIRGSRRYSMEVGVTKWSLCV